MDKRTEHLLKAAAELDSAFDHNDDAADDGIIQALERVIVLLGAGKKSEARRSMLESALDVVGDDDGVVTVARLDVILAGASVVPVWELRAKAGYDPDEVSVRSSLGLGARMSGNRPELPDGDWRKGREPVFWARVGWRVL